MVALIIVLVFIAYGSMLNAIGVVVEEIDERSCIRNIVAH